MRKADDIFEDLRRSSRLTQADRLALLGKLMGELGVRPHIDDTRGHMHNKVEVAIRHLRLKELGIEAGGRVILRGREGIFQVTHIHPNGKVKIGKCWYQPTQVSKPLWSDLEEEGVVRAHEK